MRRIALRALACALLVFASATQAAADHPVVRFAAAGTPLKLLRNAAALAPPKGAVVKELKLTMTPARLTVSLLLSGDRPRKL